MKKLLFILLSIVMTSCVSDVEQNDNNISTELHSYEISIDHTVLDHVEGDEHEFYQPYIRLITTVGKANNKYQDHLVVYRDTVVTWKSQLDNEMSKARQRANEYVEDDNEIEKIIANHRKNL